MVNKKKMKKYIYLLIMVLIAASCDKADVVQETPSDVPFKLSAKITRAESRAVWETQPLNWNGSENVNSRTYAKPEGNGTEYYHQYWSVGDAVSYFKGTQNLQYTSSKTDEGKDEYTTYFNPPTVSPGNGYPLTTGYCYGVYPYKEDTKIDEYGTVTFTFPNVQEYCEDSYASGYNGMIGKHHNEEEVMEFLNFCSYLQLEISASSEEISSKRIDRIILKADDEHDFLAGEGTITYNTSEPEVNMIHELSSNMITLNCKNHNVTLSSPTKFWFVLPGKFTFSTGFHVTVVFTDGSYFNKSTKTHLENGNPYKITIDRNHIKRVEPFSIGNVIKSIIRYRYNEEIYNQAITEETDYSFDFPEDVSFKDEQGNPLKFNQYFNGNEYIVTFDGVLYSIEGNIFMGGGYDIEYVIVENSSSIKLSNYAFYTCTADYIEINNDITSIGTEVFSECSVKNIKINGNVETISNETFFSYEEDLENLTINGQVNVIENSTFRDIVIKSINITERVNIIEDYAFYNRKELNTVNLPFVEHIGDFAFSGTSISSIDLSHVHKIGDSAFKSCKKLETVKISSDCIEIVEGAFLNCGTSPNITLNLYIDALTPPVLIDTNGDGNPFIFGGSLNSTAKYNIYVPAESVDAYKSAWKWYADKIQEKP